MTTRLNVLPSGFDDLDRLTIATPCDVPWSSLRGDDRVRHCGRCRQDVYNIEAMGADEARRLIGAREGRRLCLRLFRRPDGTVVTADCWSRLRAARARGVWSFVVMLVIVGVVELGAIVTGLQRLGRLGAMRTMGAAPQLVPVSAPPPAPSGKRPDLRDDHLMGKVAPPEDIRKMGEVAPQLQKPAVERRRHHNTLLGKSVTTTVTMGLMVPRTGALGLSARQH